MSFRRSLKPRRVSTDGVFRAKRYSLLNRNGKHGVIELRGHQQIYPLLAAPFTDLVANSMPLFPMDTSREHSELDIAATAPVVNARAEEPYLRIGIKPVNCIPYHPLFMLAQPHHNPIIPSTANALPE